MMNKMMLQTYLKSAKQLLKSRARWVKDTYHTVRCTPTNGTYDCYCAIGAIQAVAPEKHQSKLGALLARAIGKTTTRHVMDFNDNPNTRYNDVIKMFNKAIKSLN